jgi:uncharacterized membrane protein YfcA
MMMGARALAKWEVDNSNTILRERKRLIILGLLIVPVAMPEFLGGKKAYSPAYYGTFIFIVSIAIGLGAGLITGCIGAGGGFVIAPALMSAGIKGILAVGTDLFHIFAKAIMGSVIHRKLGNVSVPLAVVFLIGAIIGATTGGVINRFFYEINPVLTYAMTDFLRARKADKSAALPHGGGEEEVHGGKVEGAEMGNLPKRLQAMKLPPMVKFDYEFTPGGRGISWLFLVLSGALVGLAAGIMGVGGGFLTFPIFVYMLGVSSMTTVGTDIFQIVFTAGYAAVSQYAISGRHPDRRHGHKSGEGYHDPWLLRHGRAGGVCEPNFRLAGQAGRDGGHSLIKTDECHFGDHRGLGLFHCDRRIWGLGDRHLLRQYWRS